MPNTFRSDLAAGVDTMMNAYIAANPTLLRRHFRARPPNTTTDTPFSYLDLRPEKISYNAAIYERVVTADIVVLDRWTENTEVMDRMDDLTDGLIEHFRSYYHLVPGSWWSEVTVADEEQDGMVGSRFRFEVHFGAGSLP